MASLHLLERAQCRDCTVVWMGQRLVQESICNNISIGMDEAHRKEQKSNTECKKSPHHLKSIRKPKPTRREHTENHLHNLVAVQNHKRVKAESWVDLKKWSDIVHISTTLQWQTNSTAIPTLKIPLVISI